MAKPEFLFRFIIKFFSVIIFIVQLFFIKFKEILHCILKMFSLKNNKINLLIKLWQKNKEIDECTYIRLLDGKIKDKIKHIFKI